MAIPVIDGEATERQFKVAGSGTTGDPYVASVNVDSVTPGTSPTSLGKAEDSAHVSGDVGVQMLTVRKDTPAATAGTDGDYQPPITDASGRTYVTIDKLTTADLDTGGGTDTRAVVGLAMAESGGAVLVGSAHPLPVDIGGASVTIGSAVTADQGTAGASAWPVKVADGDDSTFGAKADSAAAGDTSTASFVALFKRLLQRVTTLLSVLPSALVSGRLDVNLGAAPATVTVSQSTASNLKVDPSGVTSPVKVTIVQGAANIATGQVTAGAAATLVSARATRRAVTIKNSDATNGAYIGPATVTSGNGLLLAAGESVTLTWVGLIQSLAAAGSPVLMFADEYD